MAGISGFSAYQQVSRTWEAKNMGADRASSYPAAKTEQAGTAKAPEIETKGWSPLSSTSSLIPTKTEYGNTIGNVQLSDEARDYYEKLKSKYHNMEFIAVSKDMKSQVQQNAAAYGNANKMVVLIDEEKLERMATDESYRKKYEGIIASSQSKLMEARMGLSSSGSSIMNFGMSVDSNGKESFFATVGKSQELQKARIEKKAAEKKELKAKEKKKAEKEAQKERLEKARDKKRAEKAEAEKRRAESTDEADDEATDEISKLNDRDYVTIEADSLEELLGKVQSYSYKNAESRVMADNERFIGTRIDFKG